VTPRPTSAVAVAEAAVDATPADAPGPVRALRDALADALADLRARHAALRAGATRPRPDAAACRRAFGLPA
jgi:hypothetical protein